MCSHREPAYPPGSWRFAGPLSKSERAQEECILLPLYHQLTREQQQFIASEFRAVLTAQCVA
jgi:dTDP-4-amino-4,6-dideoxygalactose transaminase